jgi:hypothetical protein
MIDINKKYRTRDGREVRIYATDGAQCGTCVHGAVFNNEWWGSVTWNSNGSARSWREDDLDLIEVRPRHKWTVWMNIYGRTSFTSHISREQAEDEQDVNRIACIKVDLDFEEGEGL